MHSQFKKLYLRAQCCSALERARQVILKYIGPRPVWATQNPLSKQNKRRGLEGEKKKGGRGREGRGGWGGERARSELVLNSVGISFRQLKIGN